MNAKLICRTVAAELLFHELIFAPVTRPARFPINILLLPRELNGVKGEIRSFVCFFFLLMGLGTVNLLLTVLPYLIKSLTLSETVTWNYISINFCRRNAVSYSRNFNFWELKKQ